MLLWCAYFARYFTQQTWFFSKLFVFSEAKPRELSLICFLERFCLSYSVSKIKFSEKIQEFLSFLWYFGRFRSRPFTDERTGDLNNTYFSPPFPPAKVIDTLGAGDSFVGSTIHMLNKGETLERKRFCF